VPHVPASPEGPEINSPQHWPGMYEAFGCADRATRFVMSEWDENTHDALWRFCDALNISRLERFGLSDPTFYRLRVLVDTLTAMGLSVEDIRSLPDSPGCDLKLYGRKFLHLVGVRADEGNGFATIRLCGCSLDRPELWTHRFEGEDVAACWFYLLLMVVNTEEIGFGGSEVMFQLPS
jgi:hypothetical protein